MISVLTSKSVNVCIVCEKDISSHTDVNGKRNEVLTLHNTHGWLMDHI